MTSRTTGGGGNSSYITPNITKYSMAGWTVDYPEDVTYDGKEHKWKPIIVDPSGEIITEDNEYVTLAVTYSTEDTTNVGVITATVELIPKSENVTFTDPDTDEEYPTRAERTYNIRPANVEIHISNTSKVFGEPDPEFTYEIIGLIEGDNLGTVTLDRGVGEAVGTYTITAYVSDLNPNYTYTVTNGVLTITPPSIQENHISLFAHTDDSKKKQH